MDEVELKALLTADVPPARDLSFELGVMARIERRRFHRNLLGNIALGAVSALLLAVAMPTLDLAWQKIVPTLSKNLVMAALALAAVILVSPWMAQRD